MRVARSCSTKSRDEQADDEREVPTITSRPKPTAVSARTMTIRIVNSTTRGASSSNSMRRGVAIVTCAIINVRRAGGRAARWAWESTRQRAVGPLQQRQSLAGRPSAPDELKPQVDRPAFRMAARHPADDSSTASRTDPKTAADQGFDPGVTHDLKLHFWPEQLGGQRHAIGGDMVEEARPDARRLEPSLGMALGAHAGLAEVENLLHGDDVALHPGQLGQADQLAATVDQASNLDDDVDGGGDLRSDRARRHVEAGHADHLLDARKGVAACWRGPWSSNLRGRCSSPAACRTPRRCEPHQR